jgi:hypothetical protein
MHASMHAWLVRRHCHIAGSWALQDYQAVHLLHSTLEHPCGMRQACVENHSSMGAWELQEARHATG